MAVHVEAGLEPFTPKYRSTQFQTVMLYAQDTRGLGHITRALTIARHVLDAYPNTVAYIATRSQVAHSWELPERCDYIKLPSRHTPKHIVRPPDDDEASKEHFRRLRGQVLLDAALGLAPDLVLVDHEPLGASGEFRRGLWAMKEQFPHTKFVFGLRDIMDDADGIRKAWREMGVYDALERLYDGIAVYGSPALYDVAEAYDIPAVARPKLHYCGFIVRDPPTAEARAVRERYGIPEHAPFVLGTVGSGSDGFPVLDAAQTAILRLQEEYPDLRALLVTGPFMPPEEQALLQSRATPACRVVAYADNFELMVAADAVVSMGGYNSVNEALYVARPLVIVPRATHKVEQQIRAETLAARGLARCIHPRELTRQRLVEALEWALRCDRRDHVRRVREVIPSFDGAVQLTQYLSRWLG